MCLFKKRQKQIDEQFANLTRSVSDLKDFIANRELVKLQQQSQKLSEVQALLKNISIKVKTAGYFEDDNGHKHLKVAYYIPTVILDIDEDYNMSRNEMFRAINLLNLVDANDWNLIQNELNKIEKDKKIYKKAIDNLNKKS